VSGSDLVTGVFLGIAGETMGLTLAVVALLTYGGVQAARTMMGHRLPKRRKKFTTFPLKAAPPPDRD
jgi:hypothetical protein